MKMNYKLQLELPIMILLNMLFERNTLFLQRIPLQLTNKTNILHIIFQRLVAQIQLTKGVNDNPEHNLDQYNRHQQHKSHVLEENRPVLVMVYRYRRSMRPTQPDSLIKIIHHASEDAHAVVLRPCKQPIVNIIRECEVLCVPQLLEANQRECVSDNNSEHDSGEQHAPVQSDGVEHVFEFILSLDQVEEVE